MSHFRIAIVAIALALSAAGTVGAQAPEERYFRIDAAVISGKRGPEIEGYVYNEWNMQATRVRLRVEELDASGQKIGERIVFVPLDVPSRARSYFRAPVAPGTVSTRNWVFYFEWSPRGGGA